MASSEVFNVGGLRSIQLCLTHVEKEGSDYNSDLFISRSDGKIKLVLTRSKENGRTHRIDAVVDAETFNHAMEVLNGERAL